MRELIQNDLAVLLPHDLRAGVKVFCCALFALLGVAAQASTGLTELAGLEGDGPVTVFYPSSGAAAPVKRGPFEFSLAWQGAPVRGNGRLIVMSHGSGGSPWVHADLARTLVERGFVVAMPEHRGDNYNDHSTDRKSVV